MGRRQAFIAERDAAILSLDEGAIRAYATKYRIAMPEDPAEFWAGVFKARAVLLTHGGEAASSVAARPLRLRPPR